ncbi:hypothetical protein EVAR_65080_1 [Eumeta japonica]|uniref:Uncharacterized protein n=1 Tax=Eumeta variegata TaxID=151549 RepID=A0A4C2A9D7_EUMVA|nr:hypothetical protein EVAR_65080_1 [Eumeta japonica]
MHYPNCRRRCWRWCAPPPPRPAIVKAYHNKQSELLVYADIGRRVRPARPADAGAALGADGCARCRIADC